MVSTLSYFIKLYVFIMNICVDGHANVNMQKSEDNFVRVIFCCCCLFIMQIKLRSSGMLSTPLITKPPFQPMRPTLSSLLNEALTRQIRKKE